MSKITIPYPHTFWDRELGVYTDEIFEYQAEALSAREILEQALDHLAPIAGSTGAMRLAHWTTDTWVQTDHAATEMCSMGAMLLATQMTELENEEWSCAPYLAADPNFARAVVLLCRSIVEHERARGVVITAEADIPGDVLDAVAVVRAADWTIPEGYGDSLHGNLVAFVTNWNDDHAGSSGDVYDVFIRAIKMAAEEEAQ